MKDTEKQALQAGDRLTHTNPRNGAVTEVVFRHHASELGDLNILVSREGEERPALWFAVNPTDCEPVKRPTMACCRDHRWGRTPGSVNVRAGAGKGERSTWSCNDCLAVKVLFRMDDGEQSVQVVEPPSHNCRFER